MLRIASMNLMLHGVENPDIHYQDTLSNSFPEKFPKQAIGGFDVIRLRIRRDLATGDYVAAAMNMPSMKRRLMGMAKPSINMANISSSDLDRLFLPVPPLALQQTYAVLLQSVAALRRHYADDAKLGDELFGSLELRAFAGAAGS